MSANAADRSEVMDPSELERWENSIWSTVQPLVNIYHAAVTPISHETGDGSALAPEEQTATGRAIGSVPDTLAQLGIRDFKTLYETWEHASSGDPVDDRTYLMEGLIAVSRNIGDLNASSKVLTPS